MEINRTLVFFYICLSIRPTCFDDLRVSIASLFIALNMIKTMEKWKFYQTPTLP